MHSNATAVVVLLLAACAGLATCSVPHNDQHKNSNPIAVRRSSDAPVLLEIFV